MKNELTAQQTGAIVKALDDAIKDGPWDESNFLRVVGKNLREIRDDFTNQSNAIGQEKSKMAAHLANRIALRSGQLEIFIALYSSTGNNLLSWERILANLPKQMISRPIYANEDDVKALIRTKENQQNEAYVSIYINQSDILSLSEDKTPVDRLGKPLLILKDNALSVDNINQFVHKSGNFRFHQGRLIKNTITEESSEAL